MIQFTLKFRMLCSVTITILILKYYDNRNQPLYASNFGFEGIIDSGGFWESLKRVKSEIHNMTNTKRNPP